MIANSLSISYIWPFAGFMVLELHLVEGEEEVGLVRTATMLLV